MAGVSLERGNNPKGLLPPGPGSLLPQVPPHDLHDRAVLEPVPVCPFLQGHALLKKCRPDPKNACPIDPSHVTCSRVVSKFYDQLDTKYDGSIMSVKKKIDLNVILSIDAIISRIREEFGLANDQELAARLGLSQSDFSHRKRRGSLLPYLVQFVIDENVNLDRIIAGRTTRPHDVPPLVADLLDRARRVLMSGNGLATDALSKNILYFSHTIELEGQITEMKRELTSLRTLVNDLLARHETKEEAEGGSEQDCAM